MQILAVAMVLGHTVLTPGLSMFSSMQNSARNAHAVLGVTKDAKSAESSEIKLVNTLHTELDAVEQQLASYNFAHIDNINKGQAYFIVDKLFNIRERAIKYTHETTLLDNVDNEIDALMKKLQKIEQNAENDIKKNEKYIKQIDEEFNKISATSSFSDIDILFVYNACNRVGIEFTNIDEYLSLKQMIEKLQQVDIVLYDDIKIKRIILSEVHDLLKYIVMNLIRTRHDILDKQSVRNVIGISAVCNCYSMHCIANSCKQ